jgi:hypothetical protein
MSAFQITAIVRTGGPLTKRIYLDADGKLISDGRACVMSNGTAARLRFDDLAAFASYIANLDQHEAIALGQLDTSKTCSETAR